MIKKAARFLALLFLACLLLEWGLSYLFGRYQRQWESQITPSYSWSLYSSLGDALGSKRGVLKLMLRPYITYGNYPDQKTPYFSINSRGYRGRELEQSNTERLRFVLIGGSAAFGSGLQSDSATLAAKLEGELEGQGINAAVIGHSSGQELAYVATELGDYRPEYFIAFDGWNDFMEGTWRGRVVQTGDVGFLQIEQQLVTLTALTTGNPLTRVIKGIPEIFFPTISKGLQLGLQRIGMMPSSDFDSLNEGSVERYVANHARLNRIAKAFGSQLLVVLQPDRRVILLRQGKERLDPQSHQVAVAYEEFLLQAKVGLDREGVPNLLIPKEPQSLSSTLFMDNVHLTGEGYAFLAKEIAEYVKPPATAPFPDQ